MAPRVPPWLVQRVTLACDLDIGEQACVYKQGNAIDAVAVLPLSGDVLVAPCSPDAFFTRQSPEALQRLKALTRKLLVSPTSGEAASAFFKQSLASSGKRDNSRVDYNSLFPLHVPNDFIVQFVERKFAVAPTVDKGAKTEPPLTVPAECNGIFLSFKGRGSTSKRVSSVGLVYLAEEMADLSFCLYRRYLLNAMRSTAHAILATNLATYRSLQATAFKGSSTLHVRFLRMITEALNIYINQLIDAENMGATYLSSARKAVSPPKDAGSNSSGGGGGGDVVAVADTNESGSEHEYGSEPDPDGTQPASEAFDQSQYVVDLSILSLAISKAGPVDSLVWKRIGFQSPSPVTDFRATGLLGVLACIFFAHSYPDTLLNASYSPSAFLTYKLNFKYLNYYVGSNIVSQVQDTKRFNANDRLLLQQHRSTLNKDLEAYFAKGKDVYYSYPVAASIINITHSLITNKFIGSWPECSGRAQKKEVIGDSSPLIGLLINDTVANLLAFINDKGNGANEAEDRFGCVFNVSEILGNGGCTDHLFADSFLPYIRDVWNREAPAVFTKVTAFLQQRKPPSDLALLSSKINTLLSTKFPGRNKGLVAIGPACFPQIGFSFMRLVAGLTYSLNRRLSIYHPSEVYLNYTLEQTRLLRDFNTLLMRNAQVPSMTIKDFLYDLC